VSPAPPAPSWGDLLGKKITNSIIEVAGAPTEAVLPALLSVGGQSPGASVTEQEHELLELRRDINLLRNEIRHQPRLESERSAARSAIPAELAHEIFEAYVARGVPSEIIEERLEDRGVPRFWIRNRIDTLQTSRRSTPLKNIPSAASPTPTTKKKATKKKVAKKKVAKKT